MVYKITKDSNSQEVIAECCKFDEGQTILYTEGIYNIIASIPKEYLVIQAGNNPIDMRLVSDYKFWLNCLIDEFKNPRTENDRRQPIEATIAYVEELLKK